MKKDFIFIRKMASFIFFVISLFGVCELSSMQRGYDPNRALIYAAMQNNLSGLKKALKNGADLLGARSRGGYTAYKIAKFNRFGKIKNSLKQEANKILIQSAMQNNLDGVKKALENGADLGARSKGGKYTAYEIVVHNRFSDIKNYLERKHPDNFSRARNRKKTKKKAKKRVFARNVPDLSQKRKVLKLAKKWVGQGCNKRFLHGLNLSSRSEIIAFFHPDQDYYGQYFSNYSNHSINTEYFNLPAKTVEHAFHAIKVDKVTENNRLAKKILNAKTAQKARDLAKGISIEDLRVSGWFNENYQIIKDLVKEKVMHHRDVKKALLATGEKIIVEYDAALGQNGGHWGIGTDGRGENKLGKILMEIRAELQN